MGSKSSKKNETTITDCTKIKIPKDCVLIKMGSYNVNLKNTINLDNKIKETMVYLTNNYRNKVLDIINLQGFYDSFSLKLLVTEFKQYCVKNKMNVYFAPKFDNIEITNNSVDKSDTNNSIANGIIDTKRNFNLNFHSHGHNNYGAQINRFNKEHGIRKKTNSSGDNKNKKIVQNIIISKYPIISTIYAELDDKTDMDDILGVQSVIGANIVIDGMLISIYNTSLSKDIKLANIINSQVRDTELETLVAVIEKNKTDLDSNIYKNFHKSDIHITVGTININEFDSGKSNEEYVDFISKYNYVDIFRYLHEDDLGHTTSYMQRLHYILLQLTNDIYTEKTQINESYKEIQTNDQLFNFLFKRYNIYFLDNYIIKNIINDALTYYPIECLFVMRNPNSNI